MLFVVSLAEFCQGADIYNEDTSKFQNGSQNNYFPLPPYFYSGPIYMYMY